MTTPVVAAVAFETIAENAFAELNVFLPGEAIPDADITFARRSANRMLSQWSTRGEYFIPVVSRNAFAMTSNKGGPSNPYTIGPGGDWDINRPPNQNALQAANLILTSTTPNVRVPLGIYTDQAYDANQLPDMGNTQPTGLYYNNAYAAGLGSIFLWPVPTVNYNEIELFLNQYLAQFADNTTAYDFPEGAEDAVTYQLMLRLQGPYGKQVLPEQSRQAQMAISAFKRANAKMKDLMNDAYFGIGRRTLYNIQTGSGG